MVSRKACGLAPNRRKVNETKRPKIYVACIPFSGSSRKCKFCSLFLFWQEAFYESISCTHTTLAQCRSWKRSGITWCWRFVRKLNSLRSSWPAPKTFLQSTWVWNLSMMMLNYWFSLMLSNFSLPFFRMLSPFTVCWTGEVSQFKRFEICVGTIQQFASRSMPHLCSRWCRCI